MLPFCANIAMSVFDALPEEEQTLLKKQTVDEKVAAVKEYKEKIKKPVSKQPADRQKYVTELMLWIVADVGLQMYRHSRVFHHAHIGWYQGIYWL